MCRSVKITIKNTDIHKYKIKSSIISFKKVKKLGQQSVLVASLTAATAFSAIAQSNDNNASTGGGGKGEKAKPKIENVNDNHHSADTATDPKKKKTPKIKWSDVEHGEHWLLDLYDVNNVTVLSYTAYSEWKNRMVVVLRGKEADEERIMDLARQAFDKFTNVAVYVSIGDLEATPVSMFIMKGDFVKYNGNEYFGLGMLEHPQLANYLEERNIKDHNIDVTNPSAVKTKSHTPE